MARIPELEVVDTSGPTDAYWSAINKIKRAYELGGEDGFWAEVDALGNIALQIRAVGAFFPEAIREGIKDEMAVRGITREDLREMLRRLESRNH